MMPRWNCSHVRAFEFPYSFFHSANGDGGLAEQFSGRSSLKLQILGGTCLEQNDNSIISYYKTQIRKSILLSIPSKISKLKVSGTFPMHGEILTSPADGVWLRSNLTRFTPFSQHFPF